MYLFKQGTWLIRPHGLECCTARNRPRKVMLTNKSEGDKLDIPCYSCYEFL
jgi:hypothetical protein